MASFLVRIIMAFAFTQIACNAVFAELPTAWDFVDPFIDQQPPFYIGESVFAEFSSDETLFIRGRGRITVLGAWTWKTICEKKNELSKVFIESGVTYIGHNPFHGCESLKTISVASDSKTYSSKDGVLYDKNFSTLIKYPEGKSGTFTIPDGVVSFEYFAFKNNKKLTSITIPSSLTSIGNAPFHGCESLKTISVASGNKTYSSKDGVLYNKNFSALVQYPGGKSGVFTIPESVTSIGEWAFSYSNLSSITIPGSVTSLGKGAFYIFENLKAINVASDNKAYCSKDGVLYNKNFSTLIKYPEKKSGIVTIPYGVTSIEPFAFGDCKNLVSIDIPGSLTYIEFFMFSRCENLKAINVASDNKAYSSKDGVMYNKNFTVLIQYPGGKSGNFTIPDGVAAIGTDAFYNSKLTSITIPNSMNFIGQSSFHNLTSITILNPTPPSMYGYIDGNRTTIYVPKGSIDAYRKEDGWKDLKNIKPIE